MTSSLASCPACRRHVRVSDGQCPFCQATLDASAQRRRVVPGVDAGMSRAAALAVMATLSVSACASDREEQLPVPDHGGSIQKAGSDGGGAAGSGGGAGSSAGGVGGMTDGDSGAGGGGVVIEVAGSGPGGGGGQGGSVGQPVYGAAPPK